LLNLLVDVYPFLLIPSVALRLNSDHLRLCLALYRLFSMFSVAISPQSVFTDM